MVQNWKEKLGKGVWYGFTLWYALMILVFYVEVCVYDEGMCVCLSLGFLSVCESHQGVCVCV